MTPINPTRIRKALQNLQDAQRELEAALAEAQSPRPDPPPKARRVYVPKKMSRV